MGSNDEPTFSSTVFNMLRIFLVFTFATKELGLDDSAKFTWCNISALRVATRVQPGDARVDRHDPACSGFLSKLKIFLPTLCIRGLKLAWHDPKTTRLEGGGRLTQ